MGGSIAIAARFNDGQTICVDGWTNFMPRMIINETTFSGDDAIVRETLLEVAGHSAYEGPQPFQKSGYGMVAIDFIEREIHSLQGYTNFNSKTLNQLLDINATGWQGTTYVHVISEESKSLLDAGRIYHVGSFDKEIEPVLLSQETALAMLKLEMKQYMFGRRNDIQLLKIETSPFNVIEYDEEASLKAMKSHFEKTGFPMTVRDGLNAMFKKGR